jgi:hypothetical protein
VTARLHQNVIPKDPMTNEANWEACNGEDVLMAIDQQDPGISDCEFGVEFDRYSDGHGLFKW